jgi:Xaa-Pro aminopeptidase
LYVEKGVGIGAMFVERMAELKKIGRIAGIDAFLVNSEPNMRYLAGFSTLAIERFAGLVVPVEESTPTVIVPRLEEQKAKEKSAFKEIRIYDDSESPARVLRQVIKEEKLEKATFGVEWTLAFKFYKMLVECSPRIKVKDASEIFSQLRCIKSEEELENIRKAASIVGKGINAGIDFIKPGLSETTISFEIEKTIKQNGGESVPFCLVLSGSSSAIPHGETSSRKVMKQDVVLMDVGAVYKGYYADLTRTVFIGQATRKQREIYEIVSNAQEAAIKAVKPRVKAEEVDVAARKTIEKAGYGDYFTHRTGHGLGLEVHEEPYITKENKTVLQPGMTFTIEPGIYLAGKFGVRIEDNMVVSTKDGKLLSKLPKDLQVISSA